MTTSAGELSIISGASSIRALYRQVRSRTMQIVAPLEIEDYVIQTAEFMSPPRWHIGHTSWFFETVLQAHQPGYKGNCHERSPGRTSDHRAGNS